MMLYPLKSLGLIRSYFMPLPIVIKLGATTYYIPWYELQSLERTKLILDRMREGRFSC